MSEDHRPEAARPGDAPDPRHGAGEWERDLLARLAFASLNEQRRARRWNTLFKLGVLGYLVALLIISTPGDWLRIAGPGKHTALVDVTGIITAEGDASADRIATGLRAAFEDGDTAGIVLRINSPGGSPVQAGYVNDEIRRLRAEYPDTPVYAVIADVCASGGYFIAVAADRIYANESSVVGSIGVVMNGFGFVEAMDKVGVERRLLTAGRNKGLLDPFSPLRDEEVEHVRGMLDAIHEQFIAVVRRGRGDRIGDDERVFSGLVWTGQQSVELGLVDAIGSAGYVAREVVGAEEIVDFTPRRGLLETVSRKVGVALGETLATALGIGGAPLR